MKITDRLKSMREQMDRTRSDLRRKAIFDLHKIGYEPRLIGTIFDLTEVHVSEFLKKRKQK